MKVCPVCNSKAFDDSAVCYGCLHRFEEGEGAVEVPSLPAGPVVACEQIKTPPVFSIRFTPEANEMGGMTWNCAVEVA